MQTARQFLETLGVFQHNRPEAVNHSRSLEEFGTQIHNAPHIDSTAYLFLAEGVDCMFLLDASTKETISEHFKKNKDFSWSEEFFLSTISTDKSKYDVFWAALALRDCGTPRSLPALKALSKYPKQDVRDSAVLTIAQIAGATETPYFVQILEDPLSGRSRVYALWAIGVSADERAIASVEQYVRKNKKKLQAEDVDPRAQQEVLAFLYRVDASSLLQEFSFLIPPLVYLTPLALHKFLQRVPGMRVSIEAELGKFGSAEIPKNDSSAA